MSKYPQLFATLLASGMWTMEELKMLAGLNFLRVFREVEKVTPSLRMNYDFVVSLIFMGVFFRCPCGVKKNPCRAKTSS